MSESIESARQEVEEWREALSETVTEIGARVTERVDAVRERSSVAGFAREHPWVALGAAVATGVALSRIRAGTVPRRQRETPTSELAEHRRVNVRRGLVAGLIEAAGVPLLGALARALGGAGRAAVAQAAVPVPEEMSAAEVGLRADAVEALGGGTHEPPLAPGAGELGARWA